MTNLRVFEAAARHESFGRAADELHVTHGAVSRQIKGLEDELGAQLFSRRTRHVQFTPDGQTLLRAVEPLLAKLDNSVQHIRRSRSRRRGFDLLRGGFQARWLQPLDRASGVARGLDAAVRLRGPGPEPRRLHA